jgi:hypothetical protein
MPVRGTQSFVHILGDCWRRPSLLGLEVLWRWLCGIPLILLIVWEGWRIYAAAISQLTALGLDNISIADPMSSAVAVSNAYAILAPPVFHLLLWLVPVAIAAWAIISGVGRNAVLRRYDRTMPSRRVALSILQLLRVVLLTGTVIFWFAAIHWIARVTLWGDSPNIVGYFMLIICLSLAIFILWALGSWVFLIAPLLVLLENRGIASSLIRSLRLGPLTTKLIEINLVMGIIKLALVVLAMVWSAMPLPFETVVQGASLYAWWALGTILYCIASDFFQVARLAAFIELWRVFGSENPGAAQMAAPLERARL